MELGLQGTWVSVAAAGGLCRCSFQALKHRPNSWGTWDSLLCNMWNLPGWGVEGHLCWQTERFLTTESPGKPTILNIKFHCSQKLHSWKPIFFPPELMWVNIYTYTFRVLPSNCFLPPFVSTWVPPPSPIFQRGKLRVSVTIAIINILQCWMEVIKDTERPGQKETLWHWGDTWLSGCPKWASFFKAALWL